MRSGRVLWLIIAFALAVRIVFLLLHTAPTPADDSVLYNEVAINLANGRGYTFRGVEFSAREPGYILSIALVYLIGGVRISNVFIAQAVVGAAACGITYLIGTLLGGRKSGVIAALLLATSPSFLGYTDFVLTETFATLWTALTILLLLKLVNKPSWILAAVTGVVIGVAVLTRANLISLLIGLPIFLRAGHLRWARAVKLGAIALAVSVLLMVPWVVRNARVFHAFIPTRTGLGDSIWAGSYVPWDGVWRGYVPPLTDLKNGLTELEADRKLLHETALNIKRNPGGVAVVWAKKPFRIWALSDASLYHQSPFEYRDWRIVTILLQHLMWAGSLLLAGYAFLKNRKRPEILVVVAVLLLSTLSLLPSTPVRRYAVPLSPAVYALAGVGAATVAKQLRRSSDKNRQSG